MTVRKVIYTTKSSGVRTFGVVTDGIHGEHGSNGWAPVFAGELDGSRTVMKVTDWQGGTGTKPSTGVYIDPTGFVSTKGAAFNFNHAKRIAVFSATTNASGVATIDYSSMVFSTAPQVVCLPATTGTLSGPTRSVASSVTANGCSVTVQQQALLTGLLSALTGATANVLVIEQ